MAFKRVRSNTSEENSAIYRNAIRLPLNALRKRKLLKEIDAVFSGKQKNISGYLWEIVEVADILVEKYGLDKS